MFSLLLPLLMLVNTPSPPPGLPPTSCLFHLLRLFEYGEGDGGQGISNKIYMCLQPIVDLFLDIPIVESFGELSLMICYSDPAVCAGQST